MHHKNLRNMLIALTILTAGLTAVNGLTDPFRQAERKTASVQLNRTDELRAPLFSIESGCYQTEQKLMIQTETRDSTVHYTLDGSTPTPQSPEFTQAIMLKDRSGEPNTLSEIGDISPNGNFVPEDLVDKGTVVKAITVDREGNCSEVVTHSYFIGLDYGDIPVISLSTDQENLFDDATGIYRMGDTYKAWKQDPANASAEVWEAEGNFSQKGREWERPVCFELIEPEGITFTQQLGMRIMGAASRTYTQKSFRLYAREEYGEKKLHYSLIPGNCKETDEAATVDTYKTFLLRNGGNDLDYAKFRDNLIQQLFADRDIATQSARPAIVFINGEYWGVYAIQEDYSEHFIAEHYDVDKDQVILIKRGELEEGLEEDNQLYTDFSTWIRNTDFSDPDSYTELCEQMDVQSFIDEYCVTILTAGEDSLTEDNNWRIWRTRDKDASNPYADRKWRWMLYDTEYSLGLYAGEKNGNFALDTLAAALKADSFNAVLLQKLLENDAFRAQFALTLQDLVNGNFSSAHTTALLDQYEALYAPYMPAQFNRFGPDWVVQWMKPYENYYADQVNEIRKFFKLRPSQIPDFLQNNLNLSPERETLTLTVNDAALGTVEVNTLRNLDLSGSWCGTYFADFPITLTAVPAQGSTFTGWSGDASGTEPVLTLTMKQAMHVQANFS